MKIYHSCFKFWRKLKDKKRFCWIAVTKTVPLDYDGLWYSKLAPIGQRFDKLVWPVFQEKKFIKEYVKMLKELDREEVLAELKAMSKDGKDIVLLNWEDMNRLAEGRIAHAWMMKMTMEQSGRMDLEKQLKLEDLGADETIFEI